MEEKNVRCEWKHRIKAGKMLVIRAEVTRVRKEFHKVYVSFTVV